jgi:hypothetical protein
MVSIAHVSGRVIRMSRRELESEATQKRSRGQGVGDSPLPVGLEALRGTHRGVCTVCHHFTAPVITEAIVTEGNKLPQPLSSWTVSRKTCPRPWRGQRTAVQKPTL